MTKISELTNSFYIAKRAAGDLIRVVDTLGSSSKFDAITDQMEQALAELRDKMKAAALGAVEIKSENSNDENARLNLLVQYMAMTGIEGDEPEISDGLHSLMSRAV